MTLLDRDNLIAFVGGTMPTGGASPGDVAALQQQVDGKAASSTVVALANEVEGKAEASAVDALDADLKGKVPTNEVSRRVVPVIVDDRRVLAWINIDGAMEIAGIGDATASRITAPIAKSLGGGSVRPLISDDNRVLMMMRPDGVDFAAISAELRRKLLGPASDGHTLNRIRAQAAHIQRGEDHKIKILMIGDSWVQGTRIATGLRDALGDYGHAGDGWLSVLGPAASSITGALFANSAGWTLIDGSSDRDPAYALGPDGHVIWTNGASETVTVTGLVATEAHILRGHYGGTWRYRIDGGAWTTVTDPTGGGQSFVAISALADQAHQIEIDTTNNSGVVAIGGIYSTRATPGVEIIRFGNGGVTAAAASTYLSRLQQSMDLIKPDLVITILGTNDYQQTDSAPATLAAYLNEAVSIVRASVPDCGIIHVTPPQTNGTQFVPLVLYRDAVQSLHLTDSGHEYLSLLDFWGTYAEGQSLDLWQDALHVNWAGGRLIANTIIQNLLKI